MALSMRHSPYSIPSSRFNSMPSYNSPFNSGTIPGASTYNMPSSSVFGLQSSMFSSVSPLTSGTTLHGNISPAMNLLHTTISSSGASAMDNTSGMSCLSDTSAPEHSPARCCSDSPTSPPDLSVEDSPAATDPYKSCNMGCYSSLSPPASPSGLTSTMLNGGHSPPPLSVLAPSLPYPAAAAPATMLPTPMYSSQDYSSPSLSNSMPSLSVPMWSPYPSLPNVGPIPSPSLPKLSYDSPRYKLTPERAIPLIKWFEEHKEHPYPTRHEKIVLCQSTQLTFTQVSTWFANARRRLKKAVSEEDDSCSSQGSGSGSDHEGSPDCSSFA